MTMSGAESSSCDPPISTQPNRLTLAHLLLWLTLTSILMAIQRYPQENPFDDPAAAAEYAARQRMDALVDFAVAPAYGAALGAMVVAIARVATRRAGFPSQPGHWLLLILAATCLSAASLLITATNVRSLFLVSVKVVPAGVSAVAGFVCCRERRWRWTFWLWSLGLSVQLLGGWALLALLLLFEITPFAGLSLLLAIPSLVVLGAMLLGLVSSLLDIRSSESRDIFHWIGAVALGGVVLELIASILIWQSAF
jgi:hypothetical protein